MEPSLLEEVAGAIAIVAGYGRFHIDAISRELGWSVERKRETVGRAVQALINRGFVAAPDDAYVSGSPYPSYIYGLTPSGRRWLLSHRPLRST